MLDPKNAVFPPKTAASSFPVVGWQHAGRAEAATEIDDMGKGNDGGRDGNRAEGPGCQEVATSVLEAANAHADEGGS